MDFIGDIWDSIGNLLFPNRAPVAPEEPTAAPFKLHPVEIDITLRPATEPPEQLQKIFNELIQRLPRAGSNATEAPEEDLVSQKTLTGGGFGEIYIITALALIILLLLTAGGFWWCRYNKLKAEKRNLYPVVAVSNSEYMDPQALANGDKLKGVP
ncbi:uncharacterized protein LOC109543443 isoform X2 [Dendroctonus ponderosae]|uniref:Uncharacterized protein n=1 Tax=Dendroctonus ponderosae TaxID=77166 RepID=A0AAR5Q6G4_DENPD|nr:uncharacterized protein LOC109543443 isoform X2 [Dendroctonus ponderosae]KAH1022753.1 hypothetical protein HUJ04_012100 [Dendroctonus ponderosae]KAH1029237.1 hypothetical protein HUJ05_002509 [Dendroctonus ponderosae]